MATHRPGTVTAIEPQKTRRDRLNVYIDGRFAFAATPVVLAEHRIAIGRLISAATLAEVQNADIVQRCRNAALIFLGHRPRSVVEVRDRLRRKGYESGLIEETIAWLKDQGTLDDEAFAEFWRDNRQQFRPRGGRLIQLELRQKGVDREVAQAAVEEIDDESSALRAADRQAHRLANLDKSEFRTKLGAFLARRGFDWETVNTVVERLWLATRSLA